MPESHATCAAALPAVAISERLPAIAEIVAAARDVPLTVTSLLASRSHSLLTMDDDLEAEFDAAPSICSVPGRSVFIFVFTVVLVLFLRASASSSASASALAAAYIDPIMWSGTPSSAPESFATARSTHTGTDNIDSESCLYPWLASSAPAEAPRTFADADSVDCFG